MLEDHFVNEKGQKLMSFMLEGDDSGMIYSGPARYVKVKEEGDAAAFFFPPVSTTLFQEPDIPWGESEARQLLYDALVAQTIPWEP
mmetsp:Transcript_23073/g.37487  ORF Transcript_23073/g.37487 Transcript_23073/m.37487 type:complete len:86 (-) Transcript_23073:36-293(-)